MLLFINIYGERQRHKIMPTIRSCEGMDVSTNDPDLAKTVLTCEGDLRDPAFPNRLTQIICKLKRLVSDDNKKPFQVTKVEPWNSVRVTFNIPRNAAQRLRQLAQRGDNTLRELGILSVQIEGDQVITLTLTNNFEESRQQLVVVKSNENVANSVTTPSVNSSININSELTVNYNNANNFTQNSVSSVVSNNDLIGSPSIGSSVEITRKNIAQYLSQPHIDVNTNVSSGDSIISRLPTFLSPNVVAPINTEPIPFLNSSSSSIVTSQLSTCVSSTPNTCSVSSSAGNRLSAVTSTTKNVREIQSNYGLFPFASMQHSYQAMHTKHYTSVQRLNQVMTTPVQLNQTNTSIPNSTSATTTISSTITSSKSQPMTRDAKNIKVCPSVSSQPQHSLLTQSSQQTHQKVSSVAVSQSCTVANNQSSASANVALTSPLLVNLLQSDATTGHMKGSSVQTSVLNPINANNESTQKRKIRKVSRKSKEKNESEATQPSESVNVTSLLSSTQTSLLTTSCTSSSSQKHLPSNSLPQQSGIEPQMQTQSTFNISNISQHLISIPLTAVSTISTMSTISRFPSIHPEAQGQPQVVRAGQLPLRSQISRPQISATKVGSPPIGTSQLHKSIFLKSQELSSKPYVTANPNSKSVEPESSPNPNSANSKAVTSGSESNAVFSSPPPSRMTGKTKHLINPFTGLLEPMLSDEEEEDRPSPALFPELDASSDVGGNSERSLSDAGSNGKDNNHSSDTDSGLGKSGTDVSSQSSIDVGNGGNTPTHLKEITHKVIDCKSSIDSIERLKVKIEAKNECLIGDTTSATTLNSSFPSRSHYSKQKSSESLNSSSNQFTIQTDVNPPVMAEPRVPPLHISIRGPNSAVVVSNRRESTSELEMKTNVSKKVRGVRTTRAMSVESGLGTDCTNLNKNQRKKLQREQRFLSGGGIVTSALSVCASPSNVESLVDLNQTLSDSSFTLSLSAPNRSSEQSVDKIVLQSSVSSDVSSKSSAQHKYNDLSNDNKNISLNKCVPILQNEDNNSSQLCAIRVTTDTSIKTIVDSKEQEITTNSNTNSLEVNAISPLTKSDVFTDNCVSVSPNPQENTYTEGNQELKVISEPLMPTNQNIESKPQICHINNETSESELTVPSVTTISPSLADDRKVEESINCSETIKTNTRILPITTLVTIDSLVTANPEPIVTKITRIGRMNCIPSSVPTLINTRELNYLHNTVNTVSREPTLSRNYFINSTTEECNETLETNQNIFSNLKNNSNVTQVIDNSLKSVVSSELLESDVLKENKSEVILNGEESIGIDVKLSSNIDKTNPKNESQSEPVFESQSKDSNEREVKNLINESKTENLNEIIDSQRDSHINQINILSDVQKEESTDSQNVSQIKETSVNTQVLNESVSENTAISDDTIGKNKETNVCSNSEQMNTRTAEVSNPQTIKTKATIEVNESVTKTINISRVSETFQPINIKNKVNDETVKQPLQIVITTTVPSLTTSTTTPVFSHLKPSSLESGSRVTLITFKSNLNSPNTSNNCGKASDSNNSSLSSPLPKKAVPFKLLTIPSGSGGITVRSATNKLVELINSTASSPVSPLSPNQSSGSPIPLNTTSPPVRLLVSKMATSGGVGQTGVPVSVAGNSIGQLVVVKSVVMTNPSPSIKLVPAKSAKTLQTSTVNTPSLLIPVPQKNPTIESLNANNCEQKPKELSHSVINNEINNSADNVDKNHDSSHQNDSHIKNNELIQNKTSEALDLIHCSDSLAVVNDSNNEMDDESLPLLIKSSDLTENDVSDEEDNEDYLLTHSVASDHNYNMKKSSDESEVTEDSLLNLSNSTETDPLESLKESEALIEEEFKTNDISEHLSDPQMKPMLDPKSRPNKRKSSENAAELIKACMGVDDAPKKNNSLAYLPTLSVPSGLSPRVPNSSTKTRTSSLDESIDNLMSDSDSNHLNKNKNLRIRKNKLPSDSSLTPQNNCSSDEEVSIKDNSTLSWTNRPRLRTGSATKSPKIKNNCIKEKIVNRVNERTKRSRDQNKSGSTQRSTRRSRDHSLVISNAGINLHTTESSESLHMEIVGLELSNESTNNYNNDPSTTSTTSPIITSSLLVKRKTRVGINNNNAEQTESSLNKRRRIVKENHR